jgi:ribosomal protein L40E
LQSSFDGKSGIFVHALPRRWTKAINGGYGWLQVKCRRCEAEASIPLDAIRRPSDTPIWILEAALKCRSCGTLRYKPPVYMVS